VIEMDELYRALEEIRDKISHIESLLEHSFVFEAFKEIDKLIIMVAELKAIQSKFFRE